MSEHWGQHREATVLNSIFRLPIYLYVYLLHLYMWKNYILVLVLIFHNFTWVLSKFRKSHLWLIWNILTENLQIYLKINQQGLLQSEMLTLIKITFFFNIQMVFPYFIFIYFVKYIIPLSYHYRSLETGIHYAVLISTSALSISTYTLPP